MTTFLRVLQEAGQHAAEPVQRGAEQAAGGVPDIGGMLMHHLADSPEIELPWGVWHLPQWGDIGHIFGFPINLSPTKHVVFMAIAAVLVCLILVMAARSVQRTKGERAPGGMANAMEALIIYFRNEIVRRNIGHGADG